MRTRSNAKPLNATDAAPTAGFLHVVAELLCRPFERARNASSGVGSPMMRTMASLATFHHRLGGLPRFHQLGGGEITKVGWSEMDERSEDP
jgi:hypothetical protein